MRVNDSVVKFCPALRKSNFRHVEIFTLPGKNKSKFLSKKFAFFIFLINGNRSCRRFSRRCPVIAIVIYSHFVFPGMRLCNRVYFRPISSCVIGMQMASCCAGVMPVIYLFTSGLHYMQIDIGIFCIPRK